ncbi:hypothetical protein VB773_15480 [Haloarculaceae archaeon H-GB2-1]|nr:hypothetical protein [Haloarculaceae archaeon H-GB1-1]MEA5387359.1 hypothetical protein [Haloarculaceae archaeon H-GB11]MEA5408828.1 hypothetical protein [Haloarculaceae archaeon H-GB2-1]
MSGDREQSPEDRSVVETLRSVVNLLVDPLRAEDDLQHFTLAIPEAQTTTVHGDVGWPRRPPATLACPDCDTDIQQFDWRDDLDCPRCTARFAYDEFGDLDLLYLTCPVCESRMKHGRRHPSVFDVPEWASCVNCQYHWEFAHDFD